MILTIVLKNGYNRFKQHTILKILLGFHWNHIRIAIKTAHQNSSVYYYQLLTYRVCPIPFVIYTKINNIICILLNK